MMWLPEYLFRSRHFQKRLNIPLWPNLRFIAGTRGRRMNAGIVPSHMNTVVINGVAFILYVIKYESAALLTLIVMNAIMKKNDSMRS